MVRRANDSSGPNHSVESTFIDPNQPNINNIRSMFLTVLEDFGATINCNTRQQDLKIDANSKAISKISDMMSGISLQLTRLMSSNLKENLDPNIMDRIHVQRGSHNRVRPSTSLAEMIGSPHQYSSRLTKIEFPRFNGEDLKSWLYKVNHFFLLDNVNELAKVPLASLHLEGIALNWHQGYLQNRNMLHPVWKEYVIDLTARFGEAIDDPMAELMELRQPGTVKQYHDTFDAHISRLRLSPANALSCFLTGLSDDIRNMVRMFSPTSIAQAYSLAKLHEVNLNRQKTKPSYKPPSLPYSTNYVPRRYSSDIVVPKTAMQPNSSNALLPTPAQSTPKSYPVKQKVTQALMDARRAKGLCVYCEEKYFYGHSCFGRKSQMYQLQLIDR